MAILQVRVDDELKNQANAIYNELGLDISTAIRMFLKRSVLVGGFPFDMRVGETAPKTQSYTSPNIEQEETIEEINEEIRKAREERKKGNI